jgi:hypothetical protein
MLRCILHKVVEIMSTAATYAVLDHPLLRKGRGRVAMRMMRGG